MSAGSLTLGGNLSIAVGPLGRNGEALGSVNTSGKVAAMYSYSKTRGLFGGVSVEGSVIVERQDANALAYHQDVSVKLLLNGTVPCPEWASPLIRTLETCTGLPGTRKWIDDRAGESASYPFNGTTPPPSSSPKPKGDRIPSFFGKKKNTDFPPQHWGAKKDYGSYFASDDDLGRAGASTFEDPFSSVSSSRHHSSQSVGGLRSGNGSRYESHARSMTVPSSQRMADDTNPFGDISPTDLGLEHSLQSSGGSTPFIKAKPEFSKPFSPQDGVARAVALYNFHAVEAGDLTFSKGDVIVITRKSDSTDDWWTGKVNGKEGIFPANFVELV